MTDEKYTNRAVTLLTDSDLAEIQAGAEREHRSLSQFLRLAGLERARRQAAASAKAMPPVADLPAAA